MHMSKKAYTVRVEGEDAAELEAVAAAEHVSVAEEIRRAISDRIASKRADDEFKARVREIIEQNQRVLERLAE
jgi:prophage DNA circulation protein